MDGWMDVYMYMYMYMYVYVYVCTFLLKWPFSLLRSQCLFGAKLLRPPALVVSEEVDSKAFFVVIMSSWLGEASSMRSV